MIILIVLFILWTSPQPVQVETQHVTITGGALQSMAVSADGQSGIVSIDAVRECATIDWSARTTSGVYLHTIRSWRNGCFKSYLPL